MDSNNIVAYKYESSSSTVANKENINTTTTYSVATLLTKLEKNNVQSSNPLNNSLNILSSLNNTINNTMNESFDFDSKAKYDAYEKQIKKLHMENKSLRKRVQNLTELARNKEEQLLNAFSEACEDKRKNEEINQIEHNSQLQSYYECFLQIEKENDSLKTKLEQMKIKMMEQQKLIEELNNQKQEQQQQQQPPPPTVSPNEENEKVDEELNKVSMKHIDEELTSLNKSIKTFIEDTKQRKSMGVVTNPIEHDELIIKNHRIEELELEREALTKKVASIEASLARWIFRACDYKADLTKSNEKLSDVEFKFAEMSSNLTNSTQMHESTLNDLNTKLDQQSIEICHLKQDMETKVIELKKLNEKLKVQNEEINDLTSKLEQKMQVQDAHTQTVNEPFTKLLVSSKSSGLVAQTAAKLSQLINNDDYKQASNQPQSSIIESLNNEIEHLKSKLDSALIEKTSFKSKIDELKQEIESLNKKITNSTHQQNKVVVSVPVKSSHPTPTKPTVKLVNSHTQTIDSNSQLAEIEQLKAKIESLKKDIDHLKLKSVKDQTDWTNKLDEKVNEIQKLEQIIKNEKTCNLQLNKKITDLNEKVEKMSEDIESLKKSYESKLAQCNQDYKIEKEISGTIIQQQKKLLDFMQVKLGGGTFAGYVAESGATAQPTSGEQQSHGHNLIHLLNKKFKSGNTNPLLANLQKTTNQQYLNKQPNVSAPIKKVSEIEAELNSNYVTYSELSKKNTQKSNIEVKIELNYNPPQNNQKLVNEQTSAVPAPSAVAPVPTGPPARPPKKQIHVFITGLNTCPTYCHVCQQLIPLIAYASKCQLCSFTCHSNCSASSSSNSSKSKSFKQTNNPTNLYDPLKYCHINYLTNGIDYNNYINRVINFNTQKLNSNSSNNNSNKQNNILLSDYLFINVDNKWKKLWLALRLDQPQLDLYQTRTNQKPFDTINLLNDKVMIETNIKQIKKLVSSSNSSSSTSSVINLNQEPIMPNEDNIYEELNDQTSLINFDQSSLIILLHSTKLCLQIGFTSFNKKNIWYDALQSSILLGQSMNLSKRSHTLLNSPEMDNKFKCFDINKVLKPFLELCDTVVNSYCFINENLIALACDDGLYALNSFVSNSNSQNDNLSNISLVKIDSIESAHKLFYQVEYGKLCLIGRKSRQFLSIDIQELNESLINGDFNYTKGGGDEDFYGEDENDDEAKSIRVKLEAIHDIDRCHLFECSVTTNGIWYLAVATPETIFILLFNKVTNKYNMVKTIPTASDSPCLCIKFTSNQLIYGGGKEFYKMDLTYFQPSILIDDKMKKLISEDLSVQHAQQQPIAVCCISDSKQEGLLLCYEEYGVFLVYNSGTQQWQQPFLNKKATNSTTQLVSSNNYLRWPRGNSLSPLQIEFDASCLYLFYNDSIIVYNIMFENEMLCVKKMGITFVYKPRYLSTFHTSATNCLIISNRRPLENVDPNNSSNNDSGSGNANNDYGEYDEFDTSKSKNNPVMQDLNNKICLSYFSPDSNN